MAARGVLRAGEGGYLFFWCPGCKESHMIRARQPGEARGWDFNGDYDRPTFSPSVKVEGLQTERDENGRWNGEYVRGGDGKALPRVCHSFVRAGRIEFLGDCTHALAGQTVPLAPFDGDE